jgi:hypothetical protein
MVIAKAPGNGAEVIVDIVVGVAVLGLLIYRQGAAAPGQRRRRE